MKLLNYRVHLQEIIENNLIMSKALKFCIGIRSELSLEACCRWAARVDVPARHRFRSRYSLVIKHSQVNKVPMMGHDGYFLQSS